MGCYGRICRRARAAGGAGHVRCRALVARRSGSLDARLGRHLQLPSLPYGRAGRVVADGRGGGLEHVLYVVLGEGDVCCRSTRHWVGVVNVRLVAVSSRKAVQCWHLIALPNGRLHVCLRIQHVASPMICTWPLLDPNGLAAQVHCVSRTCS